MVHKMLLITWLFHICPICRAGVYLHKIKAHKRKQMHFHEEHQRHLKTLLDTFMTPNSKMAGFFLKFSFLHLPPCMENLHHEYHLRPRITMKERARPQMEILPLLTPPLPEKQFKPTTPHSQSSGTLCEEQICNFPSTQSSRPHSKMQSQRLWHQVLIYSH